MRKKRKSAHGFVSKVIKETAVDSRPLGGHLDEGRTQDMGKMTINCLNVDMARNEPTRLIAASVGLFLATIITTFPFIAGAQQSPKAIAEGYIAEMDAACKAEGRNFLVLYDPIIEIDLGGTVERKLYSIRMACNVKGTPYCSQVPPGHMLTFFPPMGSLGTCRRGGQVLCGWTSIGRFVLRWNRRLKR